MNMTKLQRDAATDTLQRMADLINKAAQIDVPGAPQLEWHEVQALRALATFGAEQCATLLRIPFEGEQPPAHDAQDAIDKLVYCADPF